MLHYVEVDIYFLIFSNPPNTQSVQVKKCHFSALFLLLCERHRPKVGQHTYNVHPMHHRQAFVFLSLFHIRLAWAIILTLIILSIKLGQIKMRVNLKRSEQREKKIKEE